MTFEQAWARTSTVDGWLHEAEGKLLWEACESAVCNWGAILEVGAYKGRSTTLLAQYAKATGASLTVIEPFWYAPGVSDGDVSNKWRYTAQRYQPEIEAEFMRNMDGLPHTLLTESTEHAPLDRDYDFAFIDGDHTALGVLMDCFKVLPRVKGLVAFHDYRPDAFDVMPVVDWCCRDWPVFGQACELKVLRKP